MREGTEIGTIGNNTVWLKPLLRWEKALRGHETLACKAIILDHVDLQQLMGDMVAARPTVHSLLRWQAAGPTTITLRLLRLDPLCLC